MAFRKLALHSLTNALLREVRWRERNRKVITHVKILWQTHRISWHY